jgi:hypothetical protein
MSNQPAPPVHAVEELARAWKVEPDTIRFALRRGKVRGFKIGRDWRVTDKEKRRVENGEGAAE